MRKYVYIYLLRHPYIDVGYIGMSNNPSRRFKEHLRDKTITPKSDMIREMRNERIKPQMKILERVLKTESFALEKEITRKYLLDGWAIMNSTNRGIGTYERVYKWQTLE